LLLQTVHEWVIKRYERRVERSVWLGQLPQRIGIDTVTAADTCSLRPSVADGPHAAAHEESSSAGHRWPRTT
jgi:hypothetical protein